MGRCQSTMPPLAIFPFGAQILCSQFPLTPSRCPPVLLRPRHTTCATRRQLMRLASRGKMSGVPRRHRFHGLNQLQYLTTSTYRRARLFDSERFKRHFVTTWQDLRVELSFRIIGLRLDAGTFPRSPLAVGVSQSFADYGEGEGAHRQIHSEEPASQPKVRPVRKDVGPAGAATDRSRSCSSLGVAAAILRIN